MVHGDGGGGGGGGRGGGRVERQQVSNDNRQRLVDAFEAVHSISRLTCL